MYNKNFILLEVIVLVFVLVSADKHDNKEVDSIINDLMLVLTNNTNGPQSKRIYRMKENLKNISNYVTHKEEFITKLLDEVSKTDLVKTDIFQALTDNNKNDITKQNESKSLYLKLKQNMNRDDMLKILEERLGYKNMSARRSYRILEKEDEILEDVVDRFLARAPTDNHTFNKSDDMFWDPQQELEELKDYHRHDGRRIYKGERTSVRYFPFMVSIHVLGRFWCGGVIYWHDLVLTTAACLQLMHNNRFFRENPRVLHVRVGSNHSRIGGELIDALEVYFHPGYNPRTLNHNIALIRLRRHLFFNYKRIPKCIPLADYQYPPSPTSEVLLLGWGVKKSSQKMSYEPVFLQSKLLPVYPNVFCKDVYGDKFLTRSMFCAGTMTTGEGACDHDAGGPAIIAGKLVGLISFGPAVCGAPDTPTVFTLIGPYIEWIQSVNESMPSYYRGKKKTTTLKSWFTKVTKTPYLDPNIIFPIDSDEAAEIPEVTTNTTTPDHTTVTPEPGLRQHKKVHRHGKSKKKTKKNKGGKQKTRKGKKQTHHGRENKDANATGRVVLG